MLNTALPIEFVLAVYVISGICIPTYLPERDRYKVSFAIALPSVSLSIATIGLVSPTVAVYEVLTPLKVLKVYPSSVSKVLSMTIGEVKLPCFLVVSAYT